MISLATLEEILPLRIEVLYNGKSELAHYEGDFMPGTFHVAFVENKQIQGIASFHPVNLKEYSGLGYQLRGMAVKTSNQQKGIGKQILLFGENVLKNDRSIRYVWCNARQSAFPFYEKMGYHYISDLFEILRIGPHRKMMKIL